jgi:hypothetical protein
MKIQLLSILSVLVSTPVLANPLLTISNPSGYGAENGQFYTIAEYQTRTPGTNVSDGQVGIGLGLGSAKDLALDINVNLSSFGLNNSVGRPDGKLGDGFLSLKAHKRLDEGTSLAVGYNALATNGITDFPQSSYYISATKIIKLKEDVEQPFSRAAVTVGGGNGAYSGIFSTVAIKATNRLSLITEYTNNDLALGASYKATEGLTATVAVKDATKKPRIVFGMQMNF